MRLRRFRIRRWLVLAAAVTALSFVTSAQAMLYGGDDGIAGAKASQPVATGGGFDWADATVGVGVGIVVVLSALVLVQFTRNRRRLATLH